MFKRSEKKIKAVFKMQFLATQVNFNLINNVVHDFLLKNHLFGLDFTLELSSVKQYEIERAISYIVDDIYNIMDQEIRDFGMGMNLVAEFYLLK